ncbi:MAG: hypothetical protein AAF223_03930 [Bacteroidota bacterium]
MKKIIKVLSRQERVHGRVISGGSQNSINHEDGKALADEIRSGFFEKKGLVHAQLFLPYTVFNRLRQVQPN